MMRQMSNEYTPEIREEEIRKSHQQICKDKTERRYLVSMEFLEVGDPEIPKRLTRRCNQDPEKEENTKRLDFSRYCYIVYERGFKM